LAFNIFLNSTQYKEVTQKKFTIFGILNNSQQNKQNLLLFTFLEKENKTPQQAGYRPSPLAWPTPPSRTALALAARPRASARIRSTQ
jgi:hypothetical protein